MSRLRETETLIFLLDMHELECLLFMSCSSRCVIVEAAQSLFTGRLYAQKNAISSSAESPDGLEMPSKIKRKKFSRCTILHLKIYNLLLSLIIFLCHDPKRVLLKTRGKFSNAEEEELYVQGIISRVIPFSLEERYFPGKNVHLEYGIIGGNTQQAEFFFFSVRKCFSCFQKTSLF